MAERPAPPHTLVWHPTSDTELLPDVHIPYVPNHLVNEHNPPRALLVSGLGETAASGRCGGEVMAEYGIPAVVAQLSYAPLPMSEANLDRIAIEAPREFALQLAGGKPMDLYSNSLGCLSILAAAEAPELFNAVGTHAPFAFCNETAGRIPGVCAFDTTRMLSLAWNLGVITSLQLWHLRKDVDLRDIRRNAFGEFGQMGLFGSVFALRYALLPRTGRRMADGFVQMAMAGHPTRAVFSSRDRVAQESRARITLMSAAMRQGMPLEEIPSYIDSLTQVVPGPHAAWCIPEGQAQLAHGAAWLQSLAGEIPSNKQG